MNGDNRAVPGGWFLAKYNLLVTQLPNQFECSHGLPFYYSYLMASIGSTRVARRAGTNEANSATAGKNTATARKVSGSTVLTPNNKFARKRVNMNAPIKPNPRPANVRPRPCL